MLDIELRRIEASEAVPPQAFSIAGGVLEKVISDKLHPAREHLLWKNLFFGQRARKRVRLQRYMHATNSPLSLHPEILEDVLKYVFLPKEVIQAYREGVGVR